jgi:flagellar basal body rod protein FlgB
MTESWMPIASSPVKGELNRLWLNQKAAAHNLANIQTPGFVGTRIVPKENNSFDQFLSREVTRTDARHLPTSSSSLSEGFSEEAVKDLSPDSEMVEISETGVRYQTLIEVVARRHRMARTAIEGR